MGCNFVCNKATSILRLSRLGRIPRNNLRVKHNKLKIDGIIGPNCNIDSINKDTKTPRWQRKVIQTTTQRHHLTLHLGPAYLRWMESYLQVPIYLRTLCHHSFILAISVILTTRNLSTMCNSFTSAQPKLHLQSPAHLAQAIQVHCRLNTIRLSMNFIKIPPRWGSK